MNHTAKADSVIRRALLVIAGGRNMPVRAILSVLLLVAVAGCDSQADEAQQAPPPPHVSVADVLVRDVDFWDEFTGRIEPVDRVELHPRVSGQLVSVNYTEGQQVEKGDVLFVIDQRPYRATVAKAEAEVQRAQAQVVRSRGEAARAERLSQSNAISTEERDQRRAVAAQAEADLAAAKAELEMAQLDLEFTEVRAPISGRTGRALVTEGNLVTETTALTNIVSLDQVYVHFFSDEQTFLKYNALARNGERPSSREASTPVRIGLAGDQGYPYQGEVNFVDNRMDGTTGTILTRAVLDNPDGVFTPGMFARVQLLGGNAEDAILIDDKAVLTDQDRKYVYVIDDEGTAVRKDIQTGRKADGLRVVSAGLEAGDNVVVRGAHQIFFPGMKVVAESVDMESGENAAQLSISQVRSEADANSP